MNQPGSLEKLGDLVTALNEVQTDFTNNSYTIQDAISEIKLKIDNIFGSNPEDKALGVNKIFGTYNNYQTTQDFLDELNDKLIIANAIHSNAELDESNQDDIQQMILIQEAISNLDELVDFKRAGVEDSNNNGIISVAELDNSSINQDYLLRIIDNDNNSTLSKSEIEITVLEASKALLNPRLNNLSIDTNNDRLLNLEEFESIKTAILEAKGKLETDISDEAIQEIFGKAMNEARVFASLNFYKTHYAEVQKMLSGEIPARSGKLKAFVRKAEAIQKIIERGKGGYKGFISDERELASGLYQSLVGNETKEGFYQMSMRVAELRDDINLKYIDTEAINQINAVKNQLSKLITIPDRNLNTLGIPGEDFFPPQIIIDTTSESGNVYNANGDKIADASFQLLNFSDHPDKAILKIQYRENTKGEFDLFYVDKTNNSHTYLASSRKSYDNNIDLDSPSWKLLPKFIDNPLSLTEKEYEEILPLVYTPDDIHFLYSYGSDVTLDVTFTKFYLSKLIEELANNPGYEFESTNPIYYLSSPNRTDDITSPQKLYIHKLLEENWDKFSLTNQSTFLQYLSSGNAESKQILGQLLVDHIKSLQSQSNELDIAFNLSNIMGYTTESTITSIALDATKRDEIIELILDSFIEPIKNNDGLDSTYNKILSFIATIKRLNELKIHDSSKHINKMSDITNTIANKISDSESIYEHLYVLNKLFTNKLDEFIDQNSVEANQLDEKIYELINTNPPYDYSHNAVINLLLNTLNSGIINSGTKQFIEEYLISNTEAIFQTDSFYPIDNVKINFTSIENEDRFINNLTNSFISKINTANDYHINYYNILIRLTKSINNFDTHATKILPIIQKANPKSDNENDIDYQAKIKKLEDLWLNHGVFVTDFDKTIYSNSLNIDSENLDHIDIINSFTNKHPNWTSAIHLLDNNKGNYATYNAAYIQGTKQPKNFANVLVHEASHVLDLNIDNPFELQLKDILSSYWHNESNIARNFFTKHTNHPSIYSRRNIREYYAEVDASWHEDSKHALSLAIDAFRNDQPHLLNQYLMFGAHSDHANLPEDTMALYKIQDNGLLEQEFIDAKWLSGDMKSGQFVFNFEDSTYKVNYKDFLIDSLELV